MAKIFMGSARVRETGKVMALDYACVSAALAHTRNIDRIARRKNLLHRNHLPELDFTFTVACKLAGCYSWRNIGFSKVPALG